VPSDLLHTALSNAWVVFMVVLLFGGSIFVHELGHFLAARRRGVRVERFSIGFGPAIWSWRGRDGVEYRIAWIPVGGYVLLPQLADLSAIEGSSRLDTAKLPPVSYATKMIVFAAGAAFNVLFAFGLACIVTVIGQPAVTGFTSTTVGEVLPTIKTSDGREVATPASKAGLKAGDVIVAVDGHPVKLFSDIQEQVALSSGWRDGERQTTLTVRRGDQTLDLHVTPVLSGPEKLRMIGFVSAARMVIGTVAPNSPVQRAGLMANDQIVAVNGTPVLTFDQLGRALRNGAGKSVRISARRGAEIVDCPLEVPAAAASAEHLNLGFDAWKPEIVVTHPSPFTQVFESATKTFRTIGALANPRSDIGISQSTGPIGIINTFVDVTRAGLPFALWFTILVNVNLAIFNLLPVPVLDGGQMLFATIARLRGRALPVNFVLTTQSVFMVLLFALIGYISIFVDLPRMRRERAADQAEAAAAAKQDAAQK
jgi:regulator of sigma E protease